MHGNSLEVLRGLLRLLDHWLLGVACHDGLLAYSPALVSWREERLAPGLLLLELGLPLRHLPHLLSLPLLNLLLQLAVPRLNPLSLLLRLPRGCRLLPQAGVSRSAALPLLHPDTAFLGSSFPSLSLLGLLPCLPLVLLTGLALRNEVGVLPEEVPLLATGRGPALLSMAGRVSAVWGVMQLAGGAALAVGARSKALADRLADGGPCGWGACPSPRP